MFDTTLVRSCGPPEALYLLLGNRLAAANVLHCTPEVFARVRARAEADVWHREGGLDACVTIHDFYREVARSLSLPAVDIDQLVTAELELEAEMLTPTSQARNLLEEARSAGWSTIFVSDTYVSGEFIRDQLKRHELLGESQVISSADHTGSKANGQLFDVALAALHLPAEAVLHAGDNARSDLATPRGRGFAVLPLPDGRLNRYEVLLADRRWANGGLSAAFAGASRVARLSTDVGSSREAAIRDVGAGVAGPFLAGYLLWLLHRAQEQGIDTLYFIARDGQVMVDAAQRLCERIGLTISVGYLYASRDSVNLAATYRFDDVEAAWIERDLRYLTPRDLLARVDIDWEEAAGSLPSIDPDAPAGSADTRQMFGMLRERDDLRALVLERASDRRDTVTSYLRQEGLLESRRCGLVDFGGIGSQMRALHSLVDTAGGVPPKMFLVGLDSPKDAGLTARPDSSRWLDDTECYLYDHRRNLGVRRRRGFGTCVQMFCAADHGTVTGYRSIDGRVQPQLAEETDHQLIDWGLPVLRSSVLAFVDNLIVDRSLVELRADVHEPVTAAIDLFWTDPSTHEAEAWGAFPFEGAQVSGGDRMPLAYPYSVGHVARKVLKGSFPNLGWMHWYEGSLRLSARYLRAGVVRIERSYYRLHRSQGPAPRFLSRSVRSLLRRSRRD